MAIMDTRLIIGTERMSDTYLAFRHLIEISEDPPVGRLVRAGCKHDPGDKVIAAYDAPVPTPEWKSGARALPLLHR